MNGVIPLVQPEAPLLKARAMGLALTAVQLSFVGWLMLRPHYVPWVAAPNLRPFGTIRADLAMSPFEAARRLLAGLVLLAPLGVLLPMAGGRIRTSGVGSFARTVFAGLMVSLSVEFLQTVVPGQIFDVDALLLNTAGVALVHLAVVPATRRHLRRRGSVPTRPGPRARPQGSPPRPTRVGIAP